LVSAVMTLRGLDLVAATTVVAELGDLRRFAHPRELMGYLGLVPSEHTTGSKRRLGAITKTGNGHVRRVLIEAAWNYRFPARISPGSATRRADTVRGTLERPRWASAVMIPDTRARQPRDGPM